MEAKIVVELPILIALFVVALIAFGLAILWGKASGRDMDRDTVLFLAKMFGGIYLVLVFLAFIL
jgi:hypothetical protein